MISISKVIYNQMIGHAKKVYPSEACGILGGQTPEKIEVFFPMRNVDESSISYFMDPKEQLGVFKKMRADGIQMNGIYHSHVSSVAFPSPKDVRLAFYPEVSYLIVSLSDMQKPVLRSFKIKDEEATEEEIKLV